VIIVNLVLKDKDQLITVFHALSYVYHEHALYKRSVVVVGFTSRQLSMVAVGLLLKNLQEKQPIVQEEREDVRVAARGLFPDNPGLRHIYIRHHYQDKKQSDKQKQIRNVI
jgi:hypothetical protein